MADGRAAAVDIPEPSTPPPHIRAAAANAAAVIRGDKQASTSTSTEAPPCTVGHRFDLLDPAWRVHLAEHGYAVVKAVVGGAAQLETARRLYWDDLEGQKAELQRDDAGTWKGWGVDLRGIVSGSLAQGAGAWNVRGLPMVKGAFAQIWEDDDLIVSMDCALVWRPWVGPSTWKGSGAMNTERSCGVRPQTEGLHLDQNPVSKPGLDCVQGMVPLYDVTAATGGLGVVPGSHTGMPGEWRRQFAGKGDWCPLPSDDRLQGAERLVVADAGDLVLWDSRTVHGGIVGPGEDTTAADGAPQLARLSQTLAMVPRSRASAECLAARRRGFADGITFNHSPHEAGSSSGTVYCLKRRGFVPPHLTPAQDALL